MFAIDCEECIRFRFQPARATHTLAHRQLRECREQRLAPGWRDAHIPFDVNLPAALGGQGQGKTSERGKSALMENNGRYFGRPFMCEPATVISVSPDGALCERKRQKTLQEEGPEKRPFINEAYSTRKKRRQRENEREPSHINRENWVDLCHSTTKLIVRSLC